VTEQQTSTNTNCYINWHITGIMQEVLVI